ncbi:unnamed protein product, partial [Vitis vinifera]|uniref:3-hydroxyisobutyryl-CoA hydrolase n=1 Tax=Vitis vinifera TaxID=29760 RepID=D7SLS8_VITVI
MFICGLGTLFSSEQAFEDGFYPSPLYKKLVTFQNKKLRKLELQIQDFFTLFYLKKEREGKRAEKTQGLKVLWRSRRSGIHCPTFFTHHKAISHIPNPVAVNDFLYLVLVEGEGYSRTAVLNRPHALNALNASMGARLQNLYKSWEENPDIGFVVMKVTSWQGILCWWRYCWSL